MATALVQDMRSKGIKTVAFIGFADSYGDSWWNEFNQAAGSDIKLVAHERFQRNDASVMGQVLKAIAAKPDAVLIAGSGKIGRAAGRGRGGQDVEEPVVGV